MFSNSKLNEMGICEKWSLSGQFLLLYVMNPNCSSKLFLNVSVCLQVNVTMQIYISHACFISWIVNKCQTSEAMLKRFGLIETLTHFILLEPREKKGIYSFCCDDVKPLIVLSQVWTAIRDEESCSSYLSRSICSSVWTGLLWSVLVHLNSLF